LFGGLAGGRVGRSIDVALQVCTRLSRCARSYKPNVSHGSDCWKTSCVGVTSILTDPFCDGPNEKGRGTRKEVGCIWITKSNIGVIAMFVI
jgi:hypothetical protein